MRAFFIYNMIRFNKEIKKARKTEYTVFGWMVTDLGLKGLKLLIFAFLYSETKNGSTSYKCTYRFMATMMGVSSRGCMNATNELVKLNLITKFRKEDWQPNKFNIVNIIDK